MIIYFSGTGNSKYCAERLGELLEDRVVDSGRYIRERKKGKFCSTKPYVFCAPIYASYIPLIFERFLKSSEFEGSKEFYFVITQEWVRNWRPALRGHKWLHTTEIYCLSSSRALTGKLWVEVSWSALPKGEQPKVKTAQNTAPSEPLMDVYCEWEINLYSFILLRFWV